MTVKQKQWQLYYLGYYTGRIDGIWGSKSRAATLAFQKDFGIKADGIFGPSTEDKTKEAIDAIQDIVGKYLTLDKRYWGLAGSKTMAATKLYQKAQGLPQTGLADKQTRAAVAGQAPVPEVKDEVQSGDWWDDIEFFDKEEFKCKCGGKYCQGYPAEMSRELLELADDVRRHFGAPITVSSGLRCKVHNANCGGVANSRHMKGKAMDFKVKGKTAAQVLAYVKTLKGVRYSYAINGSYVHMDVE